MEQQYITYQKFSDSGLAESIAEKLKENKIAYQIEDNSKLFDVSFANNSFAANINLKIKADDFIRADKALEDLYQKNLDEVEQDYYLYSFSDEELKEIIEKPDEWGKFDFQLAQKILGERGKAMDPQEIELLKFRRYHELAEPETTNQKWIILAYVITLLAGIFTILGGFLGIIMGWSFIYLKKTLPDGQRVFYYNPEIRKQGKFLMIFSIMVTGLGYFLRIYFLNR